MSEVTKKMIELMQGQTPTSPAPPLEGQQPAPVPAPAALVIQAEAPAKQTKSKELPPSPMQKLMGSAERLRLKKRDDAGHIEVIPGDFKYDEVKTCGSVENFVLQYVASTWGPGTYVPVHISKDGKETEFPDVRVGRLPTSAPLSQQITARDLMDAQERAKREALDERQKSEERMEKILEKIKSGGDGGSLGAAMVELTREQAASNQKMLERAMSQIEMRLADSSRPPPPPPPPAPDPTPAILEQFTGLFKSMVEAMRPQPAPVPNGPTSEERMFQLMQERAKEDRDRARDDRERDREFFKEMMANQRALGEAQKAAQTTSEDPIERTIKAAELFDKLEERIAKRQPSGSTVSDMIQGVVDKMPEILREMKEMNVGAATKKVVVGGGGNLAGAPQHRATPQGQQQAQSQQVPQQQAPQQEAKVVLLVPSEVDPFAKIMNEGPDDEARVRATIGALQALYEHGQQQWQDAVRQALNAVKAGDQVVSTENGKPVTGNEQALKWLETILSKLIDAKKITMEAGEECVGAMEDNWPAVSEAIRQLAAAAGL